MNEPMTKEQVLEIRDNVARFGATYQEVLTLCNMALTLLEAPIQTSPSPSREGWLTREEVEQELLHIEAHEAPNHAMPRLFALTLCHMALSALEVK